MVNSLFFGLRGLDNGLPSISRQKSSIRIRSIGFVSVLLLAGCAMQDVANGSTAQPAALLQPWTEITNAQVKTSLNMPGMERVTLRRPAAMSARGNDVYLIDAGLRRIFRYDRNQRTLTPFATTIAADAIMNIYVAPDRSVYITDPGHGQVLHFTWDGIQLPALISPGNLARPVAVTVDPRNGQVLVADALYEKIVVFSSLGMTISVIKPQQVLAISSMAAGPDGLYITDKLARQVVSLGWDGSFRSAFGADDMRQPADIAVNRNGMVFVSDNIEDTVQVYRDGLLLTKIGGRGIAEGYFNGIAGLTVDEDMLYVADSMNARVQIMMINPAQKTKK